MLYKFMLRTNYDPIVLYNFLKYVFLYSSLEQLANWILAKNLNKSYTVFFLYIHPNFKLFRIINIDLPFKYKIVKNAVSAARSFSHFNRREICSCGILGVL